jgi:hypothetical protein
LTPAKHENMGQWMIYEEDYGRIHVRGLNPQGRKKFYYSLFLINMLNEIRGYIGLQVVRLLK